MIRLLSVIIQNIRSSRFCRPCIFGSVRERLRLALKFAFGLCWPPFQVFAIVKPELRKNKPGAATKKPAAPDHVSPIRANDCQTQPAERKRKRAMTRNVIFSRVVQKTRSTFFRVDDEII
jgi:hypothetical protein